ncbi:hypothetical protein GCM10009555_053940 [Acrocarpospora macrocephala]|uniref:Uncharacterized protein n=1 Tax=Acrocarpospora macrocephala TaxID=150177 RepID=A0A5M3WSM4_9ACTN|nr:hypothetical protein [Acrocarpospora macrocephala]GES11089.1 hypothetical protein Amac_046860 [Acrocarpospora macrocephala]
MALSRMAQEFAAEIRQQDWSDAPYRADRAGHQRNTDSLSKRSKDVLSSVETEILRMNVMWATAQVLGHADPNFDIYEYAEACGVNTRNSRGGKNGVIEAGIRRHQGRYQQPGTLDWT